MDAGQQPSGRWLGGKTRFRWGLAGLALLIIPGTSFGGEEPLPPTLPPTEGGAWADSLEEFLPDLDPASWDSVTAAYDASLRKSRARRLLPLYGLRYNKAEGWHLEAGGGLTDLKWRLSLLEARFAYDTARQRPNLFARLRLDLTGGDEWLVEAHASDDARNFSGHDPYGNTWLALLGGYDAAHYLRQREWGLKLGWRPVDERQVWLGWIRTQESPLSAVADDRLFGTDRWMRWNEPAERVLVNGIRIFLRRTPAYRGESSHLGLTAETEITAFGGSWLGGSREFSTLESDLWYNRPLAGGDVFHLRGAASFAFGRAPLQAWPDLGGDAGLRAFPPRGFGADEPLVGSGRILLRTEVRSRALALKRSRLPVLRKLGLKVVPFVEAGAVWGRPRGDPPQPRPNGTLGPTIRPILAWDDLVAPRRSDVRWDLGFGLRRDVDFSGLLSYVEIDFAWPMGSDTGPVRITVQFSRSGLD